MLNNMDKYIAGSSLANTFAQTALSIYQNKKAEVMQDRVNRENRRHALENMMFEKQQIRENNQYNSPLEQMRRNVQAGLNPVLGLVNQPASTPISVDAPNSTAYSPDYSPIYNALSQNQSERNAMAIAIMQNEHASNELKQRAEEFIETHAFNERQLAQEDRIAKMQDATNRFVIAEQMKRQDKQLAFEREKFNRTQMEDWSTAQGDLHIFIKKEEFSKILPKLESLYSKAVDDNDPQLADHYLKMIENYRRLCYLHDLSSNPEKIEEEVKKFGAKGKSFINALLRMFGAHE